jgi:hypothetical protein
MKEISKETLITIIGENLTDNRHSSNTIQYEGDLAEMPYRIPDKEKEPNPEKPWQAMFDVDSEGKPVAHIGWYHHGQPVVFTCEIEEFKAKFPTAIERLKEKFGDVKWSERECLDYKPRGQYKTTDIKPLPGDEGEEISVLTPYEASGKSYTESERIKRELHPILQDELESDGKFTGFLLKASLPPLSIKDPKHIDRHSDVDNDTIIYSTHSINEYETQKEFLTAVTMRLTGKETETPSPSYLARQFNKRYRNWEQSRRTEKRSYGKTEKYNLDRFGIPQTNNEVIVTSWFNLKGSNTEESEGMTSKYKWEVEYIVRYGKKSPDDQSVRKLQDDLKINKSIVVDLSEPKKFDNINSALSDINVREGLNQVLKDFKEELTSMNPQTIAIKKAAMRLTNN